MWTLLAFYFINSFVRGIGFLLIYSWLQASSIMIWVVTLANVMQQSRIAVCGGGKDTVEVGVPRAEQEHRQRGARAQLGAEMRDTTRLVGGRAAGSVWR